MSVFVFFFLLLINVKNIFFNLSLLINMNKSKYMKRSNQLYKIKLFVFKN